jgi:hypothetical protein
MKRAISFLCLLYCFPAQAASISRECRLVTWWAAKATYIAQDLKLPAENWHILDDGFPAEVYAIIIKIKHEAYNDPPALARRVARACAPKTLT